MALRRCLVVAALVVPSVALGHARLVSPPPRTTTILKTPPCGGIPRTATPTVLAAGELLEVDWVETIDHPGHYELAISPADDQGFVTLMGDIPDYPFAPGATERDYSTTLEVPATPCDACTLRLIQFMSDHPPGSQYYYSCADIRIVAAATTTTMTTVPGAPTTTSTTMAPECDRLAPYDRATCRLAAAASHPTCGGDPVGARLQRVLDGGLATIRHLLEEAFAAETPADRTRHRLVLARHRLARIRRAVLTARARSRLDAACAQTVVTRLDELRAAITALAP